MNEKIEHFLISWKEVGENKERKATCNLDFITQMIWDERAKEIVIISITYKNHKQNLVKGFRMTV